MLKRIAKPSVVPHNFQASLLVNGFPILHKKWMSTTNAWKEGPFNFVSGVKKATNNSDLFRVLNPATGKVGLQFIGY